MDKDAIIKQLTDAIDQFKREVKLLKGRIKELEAKLPMYENAPPKSEAWWQTQKGSE